MCKLSHPSATCKNDPIIPPVSNLQQWSPSLLVTMHLGIISESAKYPTKIYRPWRSDAQGKRTIWAKIASCQGPTLVRIEFKPQVASKWSLNLSMMMHLGIISNGGETHSLAHFCFDTEWSPKDNELTSYPTFATRRNAREGGIFCLSHQNLRTPLGLIICQYPNEKHVHERYKISHISI